MFGSGTTSESKLFSCSAIVEQRENFRCTGHASTSSDRGNCWLAAVHASPCFRGKLLYRTFFNTAVVFTGSSKSRSGYMLNPDLLCEVDFFRLCGFVFRDKRRKRNFEGEFAKMFEKVVGVHESF